MSEQCYIISDVMLREHLRQDGYTVKLTSGKWYAVSPDITEDITMINGVPMAKMGTTLFSLFHFDGLTGHIANLQRMLMQPGRLVKFYERIRVLIYKAVQEAESGSNIRAALMRNLEFITAQIIDLGFEPQPLPVHEHRFNPISDGLDTPHLATHEGPKMIDTWGWPQIPVNLRNIDEKVDELLKDKMLQLEGVPFKRLIHDEVMMYDAEEVQQQLIDSIERSRGRIRQRRLEREPEPRPVRPQPKLDPGEVYIQKARDARTLHGDEDAAHTMLTYYNNATYEALLSAADTIETLINSLGYTVVKGFDEGDPARIVKTL